MQKERGFCHLLEQFRGHAQWNNRNENINLLERRDAAQRELREIFSLVLRFPEKHQDFLNDWTIQLGENLLIKKMEIDWTDSKKVKEQAKLAYNTIIENVLSTSRKKEDFLQYTSAIRLALRCQSLLFSFDENPGEQQRYAMKSYVEKALDFVGKATEKAMEKLPSTGIPKELLQTEKQTFKAALYSFIADEWMRFPLSSYFRNLVENDRKWSEDRENMQKLFEGQLFYYGRKTKNDTLEDVTNECLDQYSGKAIDFLRNFTAMHEPGEPVERTREIVVALVQWSRLNPLGIKGESALIKEAFENKEALRNEILSVVSILAKDENPCPEKSDKLLAQDVLNQWMSMEPRNFWGVERQEERVDGEEKNSPTLLERFEGIVDERILPTDLPTKGAPLAYTLHRLSVENLVTDALSESCDMEPDDPQDSPYRRKDGVREYGGGTRTYLAIRDLAWKDLTKTLANSTWFAVQGKERANALDPLLDERLASTRVVLRDWMQAIAPTINDSPRRDVLLRLCEDPKRHTEVTDRVISLLAKEAYAPRNVSMGWLQRDPQNPAENEKRENLSRVILGIQKHLQEVEKTWNQGENLFWTPEKCEQTQKDLQAFWENLPKKEPERSPGPGA